MIDVLYNKLGACNDVSLIEWKDIDAMIYKKHSQHAPLSTFIQEEEKSVIDTKQILVTPKDTIFGTAVAKASIIAKDKKKSVKDNSVKPLNIIINETTSFNNSIEHIKDALITFISKDEFSKIFGLTKCAEIMSGIVNNRWNKSTALFISFLLDKEVYYNDKVIIYNKDKNRGRIIIP